MTTLRTLTDGLLDEVRDLYSAEHQLLKALPKMEQKATNRKLKEAFGAHLLETKGQVVRLDRIGALLQEKLSGKTCKAMQGLIEEGKEVLEEESENKALIDALLIGAAQRVEHYEMAGYGTARAMAQALGHDEVATLLSDTLEEERGADKNLSSIAIGEVLSDANVESMDEGVVESKVAHSLQQHAKKGGFGAKLLGLIGCLLLTAQLTSYAFAETISPKVRNENVSQNFKADNSGRNSRDKNAARLTADNQKLGGNNLVVLARVRREIVANKELSTNGHNVKIVVKSGTVTLRGPVKSEEERQWIEQATSQVSSGFRIINQLEVPPS